MQNSHQIADFLTKFVLKYSLEVALPFWSAIYFAISAFWEQDFSVFCDIWDFGFFWVNFSMFDPNFLFNRFRNASKMFWQVGEKYFPAWPTIGQVQKRNFRAVSSKKIKIFACGANDTPTPPHPAFELSFAAVAASDWCATRDWARNVKHTKSRQKNNGTRKFHTGGACIG